MHWSFKQQTHVQSIFLCLEDEWKGGKTYLEVHVVAQPSTNSTKKKASEKISARGGRCTASRAVGLSKQARTYHPNPQRT